jgi:hypothetical protein
MEQGIRSLTIRMEMLNQWAAIAMTKPLWQTILNLMRVGSGDQSRVANPVWQECKLQELKEISPVMYQFGFYPVILVRYLFGDITAVAQCLAHFKSPYSCHDYSPTFSSMVTFLDGLCSIAMVREGKTQYLRRAKQRSKQLLELTKMVPENYFARYLILKAELNGLKKSLKCKDGLLEYYTAISVARDSGSLLWYAYANELTGKYVLRSSGDPVAAEKYFRAAISIFQRWGAVAKVEYLRYEMAIFQYKDL